MPRGTVATRRPPTVALRAFHAAAVGQQASPGKHLQDDDDDDDDDALASALVSAETTTAAASKATTEKAFIAFNFVRGRDER